MRLLFLAHRLPFPPHKGEKIRAFNILKFLVRHHEVYLGCLVDDGADLACVEQLRPYAREVLFERLYPTWHRALALRALFSPRSLTITYFYSRALQRRIDQLIERERIDAVLCSSSPMAAYLFRSRHAARLAAMPRVMDLIDVDSFKWRQLAAASPGWKAWIYQHEARCLAAFERRIASEFDRVLLVSEQEQRHFPGSVDAGRLMAMPNGVDLQFFAPRPAMRSTPYRPTLVFTGVMDYWPNVDGIRWFAERILPSIQAQVPNVRLSIVGNRPTREVARLARRAGIEVTGYVQDVRDYLAGASACVVPLRVARGIQNKILEAMAMGRPVIATREAFEGLQAQPGRDLIVVDDEAGFVAHTIDLLRHPERAEQLGRQARACVEQQYAWHTNLGPLDELFPAATPALPERIPQAV